ncbi:MAG: 2Fe-2S iron-sulfur cluster-binding protein [Gammaproteobacteria bacterium]
MPRLITLSRAARLVGVKRGALQKKIRAGELRTFEGEILLGDLLHVFPQTRIEDTTMLERVEHIMEQAVNKAIRTDEGAPNPDTLTARILALGQELARARQAARHFKQLVNELEKKFQAVTATDDKAQAFNALRDWFLQALETADDDDENPDIIAKEAFLRVMAAQVRILPSGHEFLIEGSDSILEAGLLSGLALDYGCSNGNCGLCKAKVISGQVKKIRPHDYILSETEKGLGYILTCSCTAVTDVVLEADEAADAHDIPVQEIDIRIKKIAWPDDHVMLVQAKTSRTNRLRFLAGQYLSLKVDDLPGQDCSIASCPCDDMNLSFHIPVTAGTPFSEHLASAGRPNATISIRGPRGDFILNEDSTHSLVFIACDTGFGPIKSLIEHAMALDLAEHIHLFWITTPGNTHYLKNLCRSWADALDNFHYTELQATERVSVESLISELTEGLDEIDSLDFYACLPAPLLEPVETILHENGVKSSQLLLEPIRNTISC